MTVLHLLITRTCIAPLTAHLSETLSGTVSRFNTLATNLTSMSHHGWVIHMTSSSGIHGRLSGICSQCSLMRWTIVHIVSSHRQITSANGKILCQAIGHGIRWYVSYRLDLYWLIYRIYRMRFQKIQAQLVQLLSR